MNVRWSREARRALPRATFQLDRLPDLHRDPFDRMLLCQSIAHGMTLVTPDEVLHDYPVRIAW